LGNLDKNQDVIGTGHSVSDDNTPYYPVARFKTDGSGSVVDVEDWEYHRPWAWPDKSRMQVNGGPEKNDMETPTPTETYNPFASFNEGPNAAYKPLRAGPYALNTMPDVFFRLNAPLDVEARTAYEHAQTPYQTDQLNEQYLNPDKLGFSPLGDPIPFSAYLIGQLSHDTGYSTQFNLDSDRAFAYLTWDWIRNKIDPKVEGSSATGILGLTFATPKEPPRYETDNPTAIPVVDKPKSLWVQRLLEEPKGVKPLLLNYKDPPDPSGPIIL
jgi:hypothetical protein